MDLDETWHVGLRPEKTKRYLCLNSAKLFFHFSNPNPIPNPNPNLIPNPDPNHNSNK